MSAFSVLAPRPTLRVVSNRPASQDDERTQIVTTTRKGGIAWEDIARAAAPVEATVFRPRPGFVPTRPVAALVPSPAPATTPRATRKPRAVKAPIAPWLVKPTGKAKCGREYLAAYWRKAFPAPLPATRPATLPALLARPEWAGTVAAPITQDMIHAATVRAENANARAAATREAARDAARRLDDKRFSLEREAGNLERDAEIARATLRRLTDPRATRYVHPSGAELIHVPQD